MFAVCSTIMTLFVLLTSIYRENQGTWSKQHEVFFRSANFVRKRIVIDMIWNLYFANVNIFTFVILCY